MSGQSFGLSPAALQRLTSAVAGLRDDLAAQDAQRADIDSAEAGDSAVFAAIEAFDANWRDGRARVVDNLRRTGDALASTLHNYLTTEDRMSGQFGEAGVSL